MTLQTTKQDAFRFILGQAKIINIFGPSAAGKSTLAMTLLKTLHTTNENTEGKSFYIDTEKGFTATRFRQLKSDPEIFVPDVKITNSVLAAQPKSLFEQQKIINDICNNKVFLSGAIPINAIVLDTASHLFRNRPQGETWTAFSSAFQGYYENHILPLRLFQSKTKCHLIFVHQVSWNPNPIVNETGHTANFSGDDRANSETTVSYNNPAAKSHQAKSYEIEDGQNQPYLVNIFQEIKPAVWVKLGSDDRVFGAHSKMTLTISDKTDFSGDLPHVPYQITADGLAFSRTP